MNPLDLITNPLDLLILGFAAGTLVGGAAVWFIISYLEGRT